MRTVLTIILLSITVCYLSAQVPVKKDLMQMLDKIPSPPSSVKESFAQVSTEIDNNEPSCSAEKIFLSIEKEISQVEEKFKSQPKATIETAAPGYSAETAKKMNDPEMKKKMKSMTKEEKMKMAMEMMKSAPGSGAVMDPPPIRAALDEWQKIYNDTQNEFQRSTSDQREENNLVEQYQKSHEEIDSVETAEIAKLPQISSGEMSAPDPAKVKEVKLRSANKHIALANKRLDQIRSRWQASMDHVKTRYTLFYQKLVEANYALDSKNFSTKKILADAQIMILVAVNQLAQSSRNSWEESASWQARRMIVEKE
ncbi:MAG: hypothetical protein PHP42_12775 [Bacteroidota bacterium]|nr:hypothetical protein [Bacteroidota bacterium]